jgi:hypothetical protein
LTPVNCYRNRQRRLLAGQKKNDKAAIATIDTSTASKANTETIDQLLARVIQMQQEITELKKVRIRKLELSALVSTSIVSASSKLENSIPICSECGKTDCNAGMIDCGANRLFINDRSLGQIIESNHPLPHVSLAEGDSNPVDGYIQVADTTGFLATNFSHSLIPPAIYGTNYVTLFYNDQMHIIQRTNMSTPIIQELIDSSSDNFAWGATGVDSNL